MKWIKLIVVMLVVISLLVACGEKENEEQKTTSKKKDTPTESIDPTDIVEVTNTPTPTPTNTPTPTKKPTPTPTRKPTPTPKPSVQVIIPEAPIEVKDYSAPPYQQSMVIMEIKKIEYVVKDYPEFNKKSIELQIVVECKNHKNASKNGDLWLHVNARLKDTDGVIIDQFSWPVGKLKDGDVVREKWEFGYGDIKEGETYYFEFPDN